jgi:hypothetical protein
MNTVAPLRGPQEPDRVAVDNRERLVEFRLELELPLPQQARGSDHQAASGAATRAQFLQDHPGLDRLAKADLTVHCADRSVTEAPDDSLQCHTLDPRPSGH